MSDGGKLAKKRKADARAEHRPQTVRREAQDRVDIAAWDREPLKHYVRRVGWESLISNFIDKLRASGVTRPWKYLTFPGYNALDIGLLHKDGLLDNTPDGKLSVAICDRDHANKVALRLEKFGGILASSEEELADALRDPNNALVREFPFDVVNLDFCNALILPNRNNLAALDQVFALQQGRGFLLLLTSRPDHAQKDEHTAILIHNLQNEPEFLNAYSVRYGTQDPNACLADYTTFTQLVFSKIVARYARHFGYRLFEHFQARYLKEAGFYMISHSFELDPIVPGKPDSAKYTPVLHNRVEQLLRGELPARVRQEAEREYQRYICTLPGRQILNINDLLADQQPLYKELQEESDSLETWLN